MVFRFSLVQVLLLVCLSVCSQSDETLPERIAFPPSSSWKVKGFDGLKGVKKVELLVSSSIRGDKIKEHYAMNRILKLDLGGITVKFNKDLHRLGVMVQEKNAYDFKLPVLRLNIERIEGDKGVSYASVQMYLHNATPDGEIIWSSGTRRIAVKQENAARISDLAAGMMATFVQDYKKANNPSHSSI